jgi:NTP pyrophosphatase (non-canonical NTP hydrolase)
MNFDEYAQRAIRTAEYPLVGRNMVYPALKLAGEAGELADKIGKHWRNTYAPAGACALEFRRAAEEAACEGMNAGSLSSQQRLDIVKELGDVLWYVNALAIELGSTLETVAEVNIVKLEDRRTRGVIKSEGDNR